MSMINNFNVEHLESLMDQGGSWWAMEVRDGIIYLTNRHLGLQFNKEEWEENESGWELLDLLQRKYGLEEIEDTEQVLIVNEGVAVTKGSGKITKTLDQYFSEVSKNEGQITPFSYAHKHFRYRWNKFKDFDLFLNDDYLKFIFDFEKEKIYADGPDSAAYLFNGNMVVLPIKKNGSTWDVDGLKDFEEMVNELDLLNKRPQSPVTTE